MVRRPCCSAWRKEAGRERLAIRTYKPEVVTEDYNAAYELLAITDDYWEEINVLQLHVEIIRASIGDDEAHALAEAEAYVRTR